MASNDYLHYVFQQNNSGGYYVGPDEFVVTAFSLDEAWEILKAQSWYTDEYCECCGTRWHSWGHISTMEIEY
jgi:hypothetical protein